jgi:hypothetical protein
MRKTDQTIQDAITGLHATIHRTGPTSSQIDRTALGCLFSALRWATGEPPVGDAELAVWNELDRMAEGGANFRREVFGKRSDVVKTADVGLNHFSRSQHFGGLTDV